MSQATIPRPAAAPGPGTGDDAGGRGRVGAWTGSHPWIWSYAAALVTWIAIGAIAGRGFVGTIVSTFGLVPFLVLAGIGQMFVITLGNGHIDLSLPNTLTLAAYLSTGIMDSGRGSVLLGFLVPLAVGLLVAGANAVVILVLRVPPIVATLSIGLVIQSGILVYSGRVSASPDPALVQFTRARLLGLSLLGLICVLVAVLAGFVLFRTVLGRSIQAIGQNIRAARFTGVPTPRVITTSYVLSAVCAVFAGILLGAYSTPNLDLGSAYLLNSIAVVVLGGSLVSGGRSNATGIWGSSLFLLLLLTLLDVMGASVAAQNIVKGLLIIVVLLLVGGRRDD